MMRWKFARSEYVSDDEIAHARIDICERAKYRCSDELTAYIKRQCAEVRWREVKRTEIYERRILGGKMYTQYAIVEIE